MQHVVSIIGWVLVVIVLVFVFGRNVKPPRGGTNGGY